MDILSQIYNHPLFRNLSGEALDRVSNYLCDYTCDEGAVLYYNKDASGDFFLFLEGEFCASTADNSGKIHYFSGDYTNPASLIEPGVYSDTLVCRSPGRYVKIQRNDFTELSRSLNKRDRKTLLNQMNLHPSDTKSPVHEEKSQVIQWRKSGFYLVEQLKYPALFLMGLLFVAGSGISFPYDSTLYKASALIILAYSLLRCALWLSERYYLNRLNLSSVKFSLYPLGLRRTVLPLDQIRGIKVEKKKLKNRFFNVGSLSIQTSSGTVMIMGDLDRPDQVEKRISEFLQNSSQQKEDREKLEIRKKVEEYFEVERDIHGAVKAETDVPVANEVIFRKSAAFLAASIWWQLLSISGLGFLSWLFRDSGGSYLLFTLIPLIAILLWRVQDWRNDLYMVRGGKITDINRKPFGKSETSNLADMEFVTNVRSEKSGLFQYIFNYGDVLIDTAGGNIRFEAVADPLKVQSKLLELRESWKAEEEKKQRDRQFQDFLVYSEVYKQAEEQNRLNRLTPPHPGGAAQGV